MGSRGGYNTIYFFPFYGISDRVKQGGNTLVTPEALSLIVAG